MVQFRALKSQKLVLLGKIRCHGVTIGRDKPSEECASGKRPGYETYVVTM